MLVPLLQCQFLTITLRVEDWLLSVAPMAGAEYAEEAFTQEKTSGYLISRCLLSLG